MANMQSYLWVPKFMAGCHYNEEEISRDLQKKKKKDIGRSKLMATWLQPVKTWKKLVEVVKGRILVGWAQKSPKPWAWGEDLPFLFTKKHWWCWC